MESNKRSDEITLLMDTFSRDSGKLFRSFQKAGSNCRAVVIEENGFLPEGVISVYGSFLGEFKNARGIPGKPRYFNQITVPKFWEISGNNSSGKIMDLNKKRGVIFYAEPAHKRLIKVVDWCDDRGIVRSSDHYNQYGALYARTIFNAKGQKVNKSYFSAEGREIIQENFVTKDIILNDGKKVRIFHSQTEFVQFFLEKQGYDKGRIFFNSLSTPFFVSLRLPANEKGDVLFWQEPIGREIPGNMRIIFEGRSGRTGKILVQKPEVYSRLLELGAPSSMLEKIGYVYDFKKENHFQPQALICTNSDRLEQCQKLVEALPEVHFHIAAITEMSSKLMALDRYPNVTLYPGVKTKISEELFEKCDFYLDINHGTEIMDAVQNAFLHNHLIYAFQETAHNRNYTVPEQIYRSEDVQQLSDALRRVVTDREYGKEQLRKQHRCALSETEEVYRNL